MMSSNNATTRTFTSTTLVTDAAEVNSLLIYSYNGLPIVKVRGIGNGNGNIMMV